MSELESKIFNPSGLISRINSIKGVYEENIQLKNFREFNHPRNPISYIPKGKTIFGIKEFFIIQPRYEGPFGILEEPTYKNIGKIIIELGSIDAEDYYYETFENALFILKDNLKLNGGEKIPKSRIFIYHDKKGISRQDQKVHMGIIRTKTDLSDILPTEYFLRN